MAQTAPERPSVVQISGKNVDINIMQSGITQSETVNNHRSRYSRQALPSKAYCDPLS